MRGVKIQDMHERGFLAVDLRHILDLFGERTIQSQWRASNVWATSQERDRSGMELEALAGSQEFIAGEHLSRLAHRVVQVIDGEFSGFDADCDSPWIVIRAVDSTLYEVFSPDRVVLDRVCASFRKVSDCDYVA